MKLGYSLLLSEFIDAEIISYVDCKAFQIVCPSCKEPVFKVVRETVPVWIHYLSHYDKDATYEADCELRVKGLSREEIEKANSDSRGQRLKYFLTVLQEAIADAFFFREADKNKVEGFAKKIRGSNGLKKHRHFMLSNDRKVFPSMTEEEIAECFDGYIDEIVEIDGCFTPTTFSLTTQKKIAQDIWIHLLSAKTADNYMFLYSYAYITLAIRFEVSQKERGLLEYERQMWEAMMRLFRTNTNECEQILKRLAQIPIGPPHAMEGSNLFRKMSSEIKHEMLGLLLQLPYFEMIREAKNDSALSNEG